MREPGDHSDRKVATEMRRERSFHSKQYSFHLPTSDATQRNTLLWWAQLVWISPASSHTGTASVVSDVRQCFTNQTCLLVCYSVWCSVTRLGDGDHHTINTKLHALHLLLIWPIPLPIDDRARGLLVHTILRAYTLFHFPTLERTRFLSSTYLFSIFCLWAEPLVT